MKKSVKKTIVVLLIIVCAFFSLSAQDSDSTNEDSDTNSNDIFTDPFADSTNDNSGDPDPFDDPFSNNDSSDPFTDPFSSDPFTNDPFASEDDALIEEMFGSEDDIFTGEEEIIEELPESEDDGEAFLDFLTSDEVQIGGNLRSRLTSNWFWTDLEQESNNRLFGNIRATVYINARPDSDLRIYMSTRVNFPFSRTVIADEQPINQLNLSIFELYSDVNIDQAFFLRFGKQTVNWGVGRFWSPADIISLVPIDPQFPDDQREGPLAIKATLPLDLQQIDAYLIVPTGAQSIEDLGVAARGNFYFDLGDIGLAWELGLSYQREFPFRIMTTLQLPLLGFTPFLEARVSFGREGRRIVSAAATPGERAELVDDSTPYFSGTIGFTATPTNIFDSNLDIFITAQYFWQGEGYSDSTLLPAAIQEVAANRLPPIAIQNFGQHYTALSIIFNELFLDELSVGFFWQANWSDLSGLIRNTITLEIFDGFSIELALTGAYGDDTDQYVSQNFFAGPGSRFAFAVTTIIGGGQF